MAGAARRASFSQFQSQSSGEPLIVVEESGATDEEDSRSNHSSPQNDCDSPTINPYLLSPWRETRKHSLPTPQCTSGITASQVRRLSERGEGQAKSAREAAFLATLSAAPPGPPGGRRHSVVTISKVPSSMFGRNRRESIAAFPTSELPGLPLPLLVNRRESTSSIYGPPYTDHRGSVHNLQLDIMDDIVTARKVRMKMWNTSNEKVCEVQPLDEGGSAPMRYTQQAGSSRDTGRRYSDFVGTTLPPIPSGKRRASEYPPLNAQPGQKITNTGIVCSNTDLISILSTLTSSATEISTCESPKSDKSTTEQRRNRLKNTRSNSFDVSILHGTGISQQQSDKSSPSPSSWFAKRHQPISTKKEVKNEKTAVNFSKEKQMSGKDKKKDGNKVVWDGKSGSVVDAQVLGSAIEVFLRRTGGSESPTSTPPGPSPSKGAIPKTGTKSGKSKGSWFSGKAEDEESTETCDSSICSTLKDLFVK